MRIVCLLPGATILLHELGLAGELVGRGERCLWPAETATLPALQVAESASRSGHLRPLLADVPDHEHAGISLDADSLIALRPDLVILEERCAVCLAAYEPVDSSTAVATTKLGGSKVRLLSLHPRRLEATLDQIVTVGGVFGIEERAQSYWRTRRARLLALRMHVARYLARSGRPRPRTALVGLALAADTGSAQALGGWIPDMVDAAGGLSVLGVAGGPAETLAPEAILAADVEVLLLGEMAADATTLIEGAESTLRGTNLDVAAAHADRVWAVALEPHFAYAGPQLVEGVEALVRIVFPEALGANGTPPPRTVVAPLRPAATRRQP